MITENQLIGVNNANLAVGFYNDIHGDSHGYTFDIATKTFSPDINFPGAVSTVTAAINNSDDITGFYTDSTGGSTALLMTAAISRLSIRPARPKPNCLV